jgi:hypothetical protein
LAEEFPGAWEIVQPPQLDPQLQALAGKRAGLRVRLEMLARDPCDPTLKAYRLSGVLQPKVCGVRLDRGYRLAFTTQPPLGEGDKSRVVVLYVGKREPGHRTDTDIWETLHDLFGEENPPTGHTKPTCCETELPTIDEGALASFLKAVARMNRGR